MKLMVYESESLKVEDLLIVELIKSILESSFFK